MDEARLQAYVNLIEQLLSCRQGDELNILQANEELLDRELLQVMERYAVWLEEQESNNNAARLRNMALSLEQYFNSQEVNIEEYQEFLLEVLQAEYESNSDVAVVYPILQRRQHLLNDTFAQLLQQWARNVFSQGKAEEVADIAGVIQNLCIDIRQFLRGSRANNLEIAITGYHTLLEIYTRQAYPEDWAMTQNNLGNAYGDRIQGQRAENLELAIAAYNLSLEILTREAYPEQWARTQNNLGNAYQTRIQGQRAENLELAIAAYNLSLEIYTRQAYPEQWATTQNNLGLAYGDRIQGQRAENLELAIAAYNLSLEIYTPTAFPIYCLGTGRNLGNAANLKHDWETARIGYSLAIAAVEQSREWANTQHSKGEIQADAIDVYHKMIEACLNDDLLDLAFTTVESNKSRYLVELLAAIDITIPDKITDSQKQLYQDYIQLRRQLDISGLEVREREDKEQLIRDRLRLEELLNQIQSFDPDFTLTQRVETITLSTIQSILNANTVIWEWYISGDCFYTFIITHHSIDVVVSSSDELKTLIDWTNDYLTNYREKGWANNLPEKLAKLWDTLLLSQVIDKTPNECQQLILIPHQYLHLFPLHAVSTGINDKEITLQKRFTDGIQYIPSCQLLYRLHQKVRSQDSGRGARLAPKSQQGLRPGGRRSEVPKNRDLEAAKPVFFGIQNPTENLPYSDVEIETIQQKFHPDIYILKILKGKQATKNEFIQPDTIKILRESYFVHFACHGGYNFDSPLDSALLLAGSRETEQTAIIREEETSIIQLRDGSIGKAREGLTLRDIFEKINLPQCYLVALSACETGITNFSKQIDEYIGLGSGFLYAGSLHVINSLWNVGDFPTAILMIHFYQLLLDETNSLTVCQALQTTQHWMQTKTRQNIIDWVKTLKFSDKKLVEDISIRLRRDYPNPPFNHPQYWAGFCSLGTVGV